MDICVSLTYTELIYFKKFKEHSTLKRILLTPNPITGANMGAIYEYMFGVKSRYSDLVSRYFKIEK